MKKLIFIGSTLFFVPSMALAQFSNVESLLARVLTIINGTLLPLVIALALLYFFWGLAKFVLASGDEDAKETGKRIMLWGIIAFFVMVSVWGFVGFLQQSFRGADGFNPDSGPRVPRVN